MIANWLIAAAERSSGEDMSYARALAAASHGAFWKFVVALLPVLHRGKAPPELYHLARIGALQVEDCGPCLQTVIDEALRAGVASSLLETALSDSAGLSPLARAAYEFGRGVAGDSEVTENARRTLETTHGDRVVADLALAAAAVRIFPALKRGLGYARSCRVVRLRLDSAEAPPRIRNAQP